MQQIRLALLIAAHGATAADLTLWYRQTAEAPTNRSAKMNILHNL